MICPVCHDSGTVWVRTGAVEWEPEECPMDHDALAGLAAPIELDFGTTRFYSPATKCQMANPPMTDQADPVVSEPETAEQKLARMLGYIRWTAEQRLHDYGDIPGVSLQCETMIRLVDLLDRDDPKEWAFWMAMNVSARHWSLAPLSFDPEKSRTP